MKRLRYYLSVLLIAITVCMSLTACSAGSMIETTLKINEDLSGVRVMDVYIDESVFSESFKGTLDDLNNVIVANCPSAITYSVAEKDGTNVYTFELAFTSLDDYKAKVMAVTGQEPTIDIKLADTIWANGFYASESFDSTALLNWLKTAIVDAGFVSSSDASNIFESGSTMVEYAGEVYDSYSSYINVDEIDNLPLPAIDFLTEMVDYDLVNMGIVFAVPLQSMESKGEEIKAYLEEVTPVSAEASWTTDDLSRSVYTIKVNNVSVNEMQPVLAEVFETEETAVTVTELTKRPFALGYQIDYSVDLSRYMATENQSVSVVFYVKMPEDYVVGDWHDFGDILELHESEQYEGFAKMLSYSVRGGAFAEDSISPEKLYRLQSLDVTTKRGLTGNFERVSEFTLDKVPVEEELAIMVARINGKVNPVEEETTVEATSVAETVVETEVAEEEKLPEYKFEVESSTKDDVCKITVTQKGDAEGIMYTTGLWTGYEGELVYGEKYEAFKTKYQEGFSERINFDTYDDDVADGYTCTYTVDLGAFSKITYTNRDSAVISGGKMVLSNAGTEITVVAEHTNIWGIFFYIFVVAGVALIAFVMVKTGVAQEIIAKVKEKSAAKAAAQPGVVAQPESVAAMANVAEAETTDVEQKATEEKAEVPKIKGYCTSCGTPYEEDACVCVKCGKKLVEE